MGLFKNNNRVGHDEVTVRGKTYKKSDGYKITKEIKNGEGYEDGIYSYSIPHLVVTVRMGGKLVIRDEIRIG